ncbi:hypothetical protein QJS10_CPB17g01328 [Acorus calamus]|uniref:Uncharacterized protein n=1 Tax=Acorus calamus TaxID=4465 RepID=A0AAV9CVJ1_ACOCL|nr:hypothetical protein QJS10_CPB17g01328 [Acorus calamus]
MALRPLDNLPVTTPEKPKKPNKTAALNACDCRVNDENTVPSAVTDPSIEYIDSEQLKSLPDPATNIEGQNHDVIGEINEESKERPVQDLDHGIRRHLHLLQPSPALSIITIYPTT